jgi:hypothetical protein
MQQITLPSINNGTSTTFYSAAFPHLHDDLMTTTQTFAVPKDSKKKQIKHKRNN